MFSKVGGLLTTLGITSPTTANYNPDEKTANNISGLLDTLGNLSPNKRHATVEPGNVGSLLEKLGMSPTAKNQEQATNVC
jgi:hypothetical protein